MRLGLGHQFGPVAEIPIGVGHVHMAEVGRRHRQSFLSILAFALPASLYFDGEAMPEVMRSRAMAGADGAQGV